MDTTDTLKYIKFKYLSSSKTHKIEVTTKTPEYKKILETHLTIMHSDSEKSEKHLKQVGENKYAKKKKK